MYSHCSTSLQLLVRRAQVTFNAVVEPTRHGAGRSVYATGRECEPRRVIRNQLNAIRTAPGTARSPCGYGVLNYDDAPAPLAVHASRLAWLGVPRCDRTPPFGLA